jgi:uncharacterized protein (TIGR02001 family)
MKTNIYKSILVIILLALLQSSSFAEVGFSGDMTAVTTYVWRGIKLNTGPALQGTAEGSYGFLTFGFWGSSLNIISDQETELETDLYASVALPTGDLSTSLGTTVYMLDFSHFGPNADAELELFANFGYSVLAFNVFYIPDQNSLKENENNSLYWFELAVTFPLFGADLTAQASYGNYSSRWLPEPKKDAAALGLVSVAKSVTEEIGVFWSYSFDLDAGFENIFYFGGSFSF